MAKRIDVAKLPVISGTLYPPPYDEPCRPRERTKLGDAAGLTQYGVNLVRLKPGAWSSQRHWHVAEDEFIYILSGEVTLVTNAGEEILRVGDCAGFKAVTRTATICKTAPTPMLRSSRWVPGFPEAARIIPTSI